MRVKAVLVRIAAEGAGTPDDGIQLTLDPVDEIVRGRYLRRLSHAGACASRSKPLVALGRKASQAFLEDVDLDAMARKALALGGMIVRPMRVQDFERMIGGTAD